MRLRNDPSAHLNYLRGGAARVRRVKVCEPDRLSLAQFNITRAFAYPGDIAVIVDRKVVDIPASHVDRGIFPAENLRVEAHRAFRVR